MNKMNKVKSTMLIGIYLLLLLLAQRSVVKASETSSSMINIDYSTKETLYNYNDEVCAYYYKNCQKGYAIVDALNNELIEFSENNDDTNITECEGKKYYFGIFEYYEKKNNKYRSNVNNKLINSLKAKIISEDYEEVRKQASSGKFLDGTKYSEPIGKVKLSSKKSLPYTTIAVDNNKSGTCGSTATTILLLYYYDHISKSYVSKSNRTNYDYLTNDLKSCIEPKGGGTTYSTLKKGINKYLGSMGLKKNCDYITNMNVLSSPFTKIKSYINNKKPCIVGLKQSTPKYKAHWVVATGYATYNHIQPDSTYTYAKFVQVNDGWGNKGVWINYKYTDGVVYLK